MRERESESEREREKLLKRGNETLAGSSLYLKGTPVRFRKMCDALMDLPVNSSLCEIKNDSNFLDFQITCKNNVRHLRSHENPMRYRSIRSIPGS